MFGSFTASPTNADFGERMLNTVATQSIRHLFSQSKDVEVQVRCHPASKLLQGAIDSFKMHGRQLLIRRDFWVEEMNFETDAVAIDAGSILGGTIRLRQPTQAVAQVVLTQDGINHAFTADLVQQRLRDLDLPELTQLSGGEPVSFQDVTVKLCPDNGIQIWAQAELPNGLIPISLRAELAIARRRRILFQNAEFLPDQVPDAQRGVSKALTNAFIEVLNNMVDLDRFDLDGVSLRLNRLETQGQQLIFSGYAQIEHFPRTN